MILEPDLLLAAFTFAKPVKVPGAKLIPPAPATPRANFAQYVELPIPQEVV